MYKDEYDLEITCSNAIALEAYLSGIDCALRFDSPGIEELTNAVKQDEEFALAHAALGRQQLIHGFVEEAFSHLQEAQQLKNRTTPREQRAIEVIDSAARNDTAVLSLARAHVNDYPQDVFVLSHLLGPFGLLAFSGSRDWAEENLALLDMVRSRYRSDDWWHLTTCGFFHAETGDIKSARRDCERAWSISETGNCAHSMAHLHFEAVALDEGRAFIKEWVAKHGGQSDMRHHLVWHLTMLDLESGVDVHDLLPVYESEFDHHINDPMPLTTLSDNAAFLWRCHLYGVDIERSIGRDVLEYAESHYANPGFVFADVHRAMVTALHTDDRIHKEFTNELFENATESDSAAARHVATFAAALGDFSRGDFEKAVARLDDSLADSVLLGGSNPQRRIVEDTYLEACLRDGQLEKVRRVLKSRARISSVFDQNQLKRADAACN